MNAKAKSKRSSKAGGRPSSNERNDTAIDDSTFDALLADLGSGDWLTVQEAVTRAGECFASAPIADPRLDQIADRIAALAAHPKWEVRREVAAAATHSRNSRLRAPLARLANDDNQLVRRAAERAMAHRRDWSHSSALHREHAARIDALLEDIEARFGQRGLAAVKATAEEIARVSSRELYHEVIKLVSPLAASAERVRALLEPAATTPVGLELDRFDSRLRSLSATIEAMRGYTAQTVAAFRSESVRQLVDESVGIIMDRPSSSGVPTIDIKIDANLVAELDRTRFQQALNNLLVNAVEAYEGLDSSRPIAVRGVVEEGVRLVLEIEDGGCGMTEDGIREAQTLFVTTKEHGTGFGLPLAIKIIDFEHAGRLSIASELGRGTTVTIAVPLRREGARL